MSTKPPSPFCRATISAIPVFYILTTVIGAIRWYTPVPLADMWDSYVMFYFNITHGHWHDWFSQANEHRIILARILFWLDIRYFGARSILLIVSNLCFMAGIWIGFSWAAKRLLPKQLWLVTSACVAAPCFSWMQQENIWWANQNQFWSAYLVPLWAFLLMSRSTNEDRGWFIGALFLGVLSLGTMANGVIVLPMLLAMHCLKKKFDLKRAGIILVIAAVAISLWLYRYQVLPHPNASLFDIARFIVIFLGGPFVHVFASYSLGYFFGGVFILLAGLLFFDWLLNRQHRDPVFLALVIFCGYVLAASIAAATGRAFGGVDAALASRYSTPALLGWTSIAILAVYKIKSRADAFSTTAVAGSLTAIALVSIQMSCLNEEGPAAVRREYLGALAAVLKINDLRAIQAIYPVESTFNQGRIKNTTSEAEAMHIAIYSDPTFEVIAASIGKSPAPSGLVACDGAVDLTPGIPTDPSQQRADGWAYDSARKRVPPAVLFVNDNKIVGAAVTGKQRSDISEAFGRSASGAGFDGYLSAGVDKTKLKLLCVG